MTQSSRLLPYRYYCFPIIILNIVGILITCYLSISHYLIYTDQTYASFCAISQSINCDTVARSPWSVILNLPVSLWGLFSYFFCLIISLFLIIKKDLFFPLWKTIFFLSLLFSITSVFFACIAIFKIHSMCILCIATYGINFALLYQSWIICRRFDIPILVLEDIKNPLILLLSKKRLYVSIIFWFILLISFHVFLPHYWELESIEIPTDIARGITEEGHPWIGSEKPTLIIEEFSDYQCFQCLKMQSTLRQLIEEHPDKIRLVHRHYPMDHEYNPIVVPTPFHVGAGKMALLAIYAMTQDKFWEMNDALFQLGRNKSPFNIKFLAEQTKIPVEELSFALTSPDIKKILNHDIVTGMKNRITATPTFLINGKKYTGFIPPEILEEALRP